MDLGSAVDFIAVVCSCLSFIFSSSLWFLLWIIRNKNKESKQKCSAILLTTHVYFMAGCDVLISIWCILTYSSVLFSPNTLFFNQNPSDLDMNELSFATISENLSCFLLAILGQFAVISSAIWYLLISYCLWRILFGHNPLSINTKRNKPFVLSTSFTSAAAMQHNIKFRKRPDENYDIPPLKEDESVKIFATATPAMETKISETTNEDTGTTSPTIKFLNTPSIDSSLGGSLLHSPKDTSRGGSGESYQFRERKELSRILKRHHCIVWSISIVFTLIPFCHGSMGINIAYMSDMERGLKCWIGSKFWVFSFYSVLTIAVLNAMCMLLYISFKILKNGEYNLDHRSPRPREYTHRSKMRRSTGGTRNYKVLNRFGVFVGCYLLCWILPIVRRYYAAFIDAHNVPDWLILSSEVSIAIFPMANAIVWYTNPSFRKLISQHLIFIIKYDCCRRRRYSSRPEQDAPGFKVHIGPKSLPKEDNTHRPVRVRQDNKSTGGFSTLTTNPGTSYGSFCDNLDIATYSSHYSYPMDRDSRVMDEDGMSLDGGMRSDDTDDTTDDTASFGGTIDTVSMDPILFEKKGIVQPRDLGKRLPDISLSSVRLPSQLSDVVVATYSSSLSDEMKREHKRFSSDFTDIVAMQSRRSSVMGSDVHSSKDAFAIVVTPRDEVHRPHVVTPREMQLARQESYKGNKDATNNKHIATGLFTEDELKKFQNSINEFSIHNEDTENESNGKNGNEQE